MPLLLAFLLTCSIVCAKSPSLSTGEKAELDDLIKELLAKDPDTTTVIYDKGKHIIDRATHIEKKNFLIVYLQREKNNLYLYQNVERADFLPLLKTEGSAKHWGKVLSQNEKFKIHPDDRRITLKNLLKKITGK